jgi:hypothetical protein
MADRLLNLIEPDHLGHSARLLGWICGGLLGAIVATATLVLVFGTRIG